MWPNPQETEETLNKKLHFLYNDYRIPLLADSDDFKPVF